MQTAMLNGKTGIVTGASRGMGVHFVDTLLAQGARVAALARPSVDLDALASRHGDRLAVFACDVSQPGEVTRAVGLTAERFGRLDFLVNNAAIFHPFRLEEATDADIADHIGVNLAGPMWCMRAAIPHLRRSKGQIISISSESVRMPYPFLGVYAATKAGLEGLSAAMREELREDGIRVTALRSGAVEGGTGGRNWDPTVRDRFFETIARTGHGAFSGKPASAQSMAQALVSVLTLPPDINVDIIEVRAANTGSPDTRSAEA
jgi:NAD(P)-dependent dehydrogenase (short-subunit alcohol dehydrogenase family)